VTKEQEIEQLKAELAAEKQRRSDDSLQLAAKVSDLIDALRPFASIADSFLWQKDSDPVWNGYAQPRIGDFRRAFSLVFGHDHADYLESHELGERVVLPTSVILPFVNTYRFFLEKRAEKPGISYTKLVAGYIDDELVWDSIADLVEAFDKARG